MTKQVEVVLKRMMVGSLRYRAHDAWSNYETEMHNTLNALADCIEDGSATEGEWLEAISQVDMGDDDE